MATRESPKKLEVITSGSDNFGAIVVLKREIVALDVQLIDLRFQRSGFDVQ